MSAHDLHIVKPGTKVRLDDIDPSKTPGLSGPNDLEKAAAIRELAQNTEAMKLLQRRLYAESERSLLVVLQGMDCGGKDGTIRHVLGPLNPQGVRVASFKKPTDEFQRLFVLRHRVLVRHCGQQGTIPGRVVGEVFKLR